MLLNYSTRVPVSRTVAEIQARLVEHGARAVSVNYDEDGVASAMTFSVPFGSQTLHFRLPVDIASTSRVLEDQGAAPRFLVEQHVYKVAWRIIKDWIEAQMALLETEMVKLEQIFLPYLVDSKGQSLYELMCNRGFLLTDGKGIEGGVHS